MCVGNGQFCLFRVIPCHEMRCVMIQGESLHAQAGKTPVQAKFDFILTYIGPYIVMYFYSKTNQVHQCLKCILFWNDNLHVSDGLSVHHQEFRTAHTATGICQTDTSVCLLARTPHDGRKDRPKHVE